jgi:hypothetical protein
MLIFEIFYSITIKILKYPQNPDENPDLPMNFKIMMKKYAIPKVKDSCSKKISKRNLFWERNPYASAGVNESLKSSEASIWILLLCEFRLKSLEPSSVMARRRMPEKFYYS